MQPLIETDRLLLRPFRASDAEDCFAFLSDRKTCYLDGGYEPYTAKDERFWKLMDIFASGEGRYMVERKEDGRVIGVLHLFPDDRRAVEAMEIGYVIAPDCRRRGYAREAVEAVMDHLFRETDTALITAGAADCNDPSITMLEKLGFVREGILRKGFYIPGRGAVDMVSFYRERT